MVRPVRDVIIIGAGGHAVSVAETVLASGLRIRAFVSESPGTAELLGVPVVTPDSHPEQDSSTLVVLAIGDNSQRERVWHRYIGIMGEDRFPSVIHPSASVSSLASVAPGTVILQGAIVGSAAHVGYACLINTGAVLDHESVLEDFASLAPGAVTGGRVRIGTRSAISIGAVLTHGISVGPDTVIGASSLVYRDIPGNVVAYGTPARVVRPREANDPYLTSRTTTTADQEQAHA
jgi:sugar O-acyltransferase (sialic acid O-acetyltransferase NeuD family)